MSNEYKDWYEDRAFEVVIENNLITHIAYYTKWDDGFLFVGDPAFGDNVVYFVWLDDIDGWSYRQIYI